MPRELPFTITLSDEQFAEYQRSQLRKVREQAAQLTAEVDALIAEAHTRAGGKLPLAERVHM